MDHFRAKLEPNPWQPIRANPKPKMICTARNPNANSPIRNRATNMLPVPGSHNVLDIGQSVESAGWKPPWYGLNDDINP
jgi:hypothetical protein